MKIKLHLPVLYNEQTLEVKGEASIIGSRLDWGVTYDDIKILFKSTDITNLIRDTIIEDKVLDAVDEFIYGVYFKNKNEFEN